MPPIENTIRAGSEFDRKASEFSALLQVLRDHHGRVLAGGGEKLRARHIERGKIPVRERIDHLVDPLSPFLELSPLAAWGLYGNEVPSAGIVTGIGIVTGLPCMIIANDATVKGGSFFHETVKKHLRAQEIAEENRLPCIYLVDCGGAFLPEQDRVFPDRDHFGGTFFQQCRMSAAGLPQISAVFGGCTAGGAYIPALSDEVVMVRGTGRIHLGGPPIVKAAIKEVVDGETLGGAEMHSTVSGVSDYLAENELEAIAKLRDIVGALKWPREARSQRPVSAPLHDPAEIPGIVGTDLKQPYDVREVIARIVDGSEFQEFKPAYGSSLVCGFAADSRRAGRHPRQQRRAVLRVRGKGRAFHRAVRPAPHTDPVPAEHHRLHGGNRRRARRHRQAFGQAGLCGFECAGAALHRDHRRLLRRRQLRHVRPRFSAAVPVRMAECAHRDHERRGRRQRGDGSAPRQPHPRRGGRGGNRQGRSRDSRAVRGAERPRITPPRGFGTTASSSPSRPATCWVSASRSRAGNRAARHTAPSTGCDASDPLPSGRQPRRDRRSHHPHLPAARHPHDRGLFRRRSPCAACRARRRGVPDRPFARPRQLSESRRASWRPAGAPAPMRSIRATASCRKSRNCRACARGSRHRVRRPVRRRASLPWVRRSDPSSSPRARALPSVPGYLGDDQSDARLDRRGEAHRLSVDGQGFGRRRRASGMRRVFARSRTRRRRSRSRGGRPRRRSAIASLLIEKLVLRPRHLEVQIAGDKHGNVVHLFERDCSVQRNNQKLLEEAPAPNLPAAIRATLLERAVALGRAPSATTISARSSSSSKRARRIPGSWK